MLPVDPARYALFASVMAVFAVTPGPANLFAIATGIRSGPKAALLGVAGMNVATLVWVAAAALGLGALVMAFPVQFHLIAIAGGLYIAWLGLKSLWSAYKGSAPIKTAVAANQAARFATASLCNWRIRRRSSSSPPCCRPSSIRRGRSCRSLRCLARP